MHVPVPARQGGLIGSCIGTPLTPFFFLLARGPKSRTSRIFRGPLENQICRRTPRSDCRLDFRTQIGKVGREKLVPRGREHFFWNFSVPPGTIRDHLGAFWDFWISAEILDLGPKNGPQGDPVCSQRDPVSSQRDPVSSQRDPVSSQRWPGLVIAWPGLVKAWPGLGPIWAQGPGPGPPPGGQATL